MFPRSLSYDGDPWYGVWYYAPYVSPGDIDIEAWVQLPEKGGYSPSDEFDEIIDIIQNVGASLMFVAWFTGVSAVANAA